MRRPARSWRQGNILHSSFWETTSQLDGLVTESSFHKTKTRVPDLWLVSSLPNLQLQSSLDVQCLGAAVTCVTITVTVNFNQLYPGDTMIQVTASGNSETKNSANIKSWRLRAVRGTCKNTGPPAICRVSKQCFQTWNSQSYRQAIQLHQHSMKQEHCQRGRALPPAPKVPLL